MRQGRKRVRRNEREEQESVRIIERGRKGKRIRKIRKGRGKIMGKERGEMERWWEGERGRQERGRK